MNSPRRMFFPVIARSGATKQSRRHRRLDCFASLAITVRVRSPMHLDNAAAAARMARSRRETSMNAPTNGPAGKSTNRVYRVAVIPGDGIGKEVVPEGVRVLEAAAKKFGFGLRHDHLDFASCHYYETHARMMPEDLKDKIGRHDAVSSGAVGWPAKVPDHDSLWGSLILFRREFD